MTYRDDGDALRIENEALRRRVRELEAPAEDETAPEAPPASREGVGTLWAVLAYVAALAASYGALEVLLPLLGLALLLANLVVATPFLLAATNDVWSEDPVVCRLARRVVLSTPLWILAAAPLFIGLTFARLVIAYLASHRG